MPLPASPCEIVVWSTATIQPDYLITVGDCKYSVPYEFIGKEVDVRVTEKCIEVFYHNNRVASHVKREHDLNPIYTPENHEGIRLTIRNHFWNGGKRRRVDPLGC